MRDDRRNSPRLCSLKARGFEARTADDAGDEKFPFVAFTAPPTQNPDYPAAVRWRAHAGRVVLVAHPVTMSRMHTPFQR